MKSIRWIISISLLSMTLLFWAGCDNDDGTTGPSPGPIVGVFEDGTDDIVSGGEFQGLAPIDIGKVTAELSSSHLRFVIQLAGDGVISAPSTDEQNSLVGMIDIDIDYDADSLARGAVFSFSGDAGIVEEGSHGVCTDLMIDFSSEVVRPGYFRIVKWGGEVLGWIETTISTDRIETAIPLSLLVDVPIGDKIAFAVLIGDEAGPTDVAPTTPGILTLE